MPLDRNLLREDNAEGLATLKASQKARGKPEKTIDDLVVLDKKWRVAQYEVEKLRSKINAQNKKVGQAKKEKNETAAAAAVAEAKAMQAEELRLRELAEQCQTDLVKEWNKVGNLVDATVPVSSDEKDNKIVSSWGPTNRTGKELHHHELLHMIGGYDAPRAVEVAGHRAYYLKGPGVLLNQALINFGIKYLMDKQYCPIQPPYFMNRSVMGETAQLEDFDEQLYKVTGETADEDKYLIATSEQPISAFHRKETLNAAQLPLRYAGISTCFRKEAGSHGRDAWGIFRIHQFEKVEQFCITTPEESAKMHEEMIKIAEGFYKELGLSYRVVNIVSGELNNAAAKKYDLEAWFPTLGVFRELVSASNCTDYQSRAMETKLGAKKSERHPIPFVHMLNATLCATERTICCLLENYQTENGVRVPDVLQPYMGGLKFMPFVAEKPVNVTAAKQAAAADRKGQPRPQGADKATAAATVADKPAAPAAAAAVAAAAPAAAEVKEDAAAKATTTATTTTAAKDEPKKADAAPAAKEEPKKEGESASKASKNKKKKNKNKNKDGKDAAATEAAKP